MPYTSRQTESERERGREKETKFLYNVIILISNSVQTNFLTIDNFVILIFCLTVKHYESRNKFFQMFTCFMKNEDSENIYTFKNLYLNLLFVFECS